MSESTGPRIIADALDSKRRKYSARAKNACETAAHTLRKAASAIECLEARVRELEALLGEATHGLDDGACAMCRGRGLVFGNPLPGGRPEQTCPKCAGTGEAASDD